MTKYHIQHKLVGKEDTILADSFTLTTNEGNVIVNFYEHIMPTTLMEKWFIGITWNLVATVTGKELTITKIL